MATNSAMSGPLGMLRGMTYDPVRRRYFPSTAPSPAPSSSSSASSSSPSSASSASSSSSSGSAGPVRTDRLPTQEELRGFSYAGARRYSREHGLPSPIMCDRDRSKRRRIKEQREFEAKIKREKEEAEHRLGMLDQEGVSRTFRRRTILRAKRDVESADHLHLARLHQRDRVQLTDCPHEKVTSLMTTVNAGFYCTTDGGRIITSHPSGALLSITACESPIIGLHMDVARLTSMSISSGSDPHIHRFRRCPEGPDIWLHHADVELPKTDIFASSAYDGKVSIAAKGMLVVANPSESDIRSDLERRPVTSDPLAVHHASPDLVYLGLRKGVILQEDLRVSPRRGTVVAIARPPIYRTSRAVVGVKRLKDGAPWGMAVSAMGHPIMIFDIRYGQEPLHQLIGHNNDYRTDLGFTTSPDDSIVLAASDERGNHHIRGWSTHTGEVIRGRVDPDASRKANKTMPYFFGNGPNMLETGFRSRVTALQFRSDGGVDAVSDGTLMRFGSVYEGDGPEPNDDLYFE